MWIPLTLSDSNFKRHGGLLQCKHCGKAFASHAAHDSHVRRTHVSFSTVATVTKNITTTTTAPAAATIVCSICRMTFLYPHQLKLHVCSGQYSWLPAIRSLERRARYLFYCMFFCSLFLSTIYRQPAGRFTPNFACGRTLVPDVSSPLLGFSGPRGRKRGKLNFRYYRSQWGILARMAGLLLTHLLVLSLLWRERDVLNHTTSYYVIYHWSSLIAGPPSRPDVRWLLTSVRHPSVVRPVVISQKLNKIDPQLLWNTIRKSASLILFLHSNPLPGRSPG